MGPNFSTKRKFGVMGKAPGYQTDALILTFNPALAKGWLVWASHTCSALGNRQNDQLLLKKPWQVN